MQHPLGGYFLLELTMAFTAQSLLPYLPVVRSASVPVANWYVGFSGGLDSTVLLHALCALQLPVKLQALHINHQISPYADHWQLQCANYCAALGIPFHAEQVKVVNTGKGIEDAARAARYGVFERYLANQDVLLTAHHADDQAETLLLRLMRGAGPRGLAAMAPQRALGAGVLHRPLLGFARLELEAYAQAHQLTWVEDESNGDIHYDRNFLRTQVMPLLHQRWPHFKRKWQQTSELCAANEGLVEALAQQDLLALGVKTERLGSSVALTDFLSLAEARQQNVLRYWLRTHGFTIPEQTHWQQLARQLHSARTDMEMDVSWGNVSLRVYQQRLYALPLAFFTEAAPSVSVLLDTANRHIALPWGTLVIAYTDTEAADRLKRLPGTLRIAYRQGGERCKPARRQHSQTLKRLLQEYGVEPWLRAKIPLVYCGDELVAVGDLWVCAGFVAEPGETGLVFSWQLP